jgi:hypothetical protein
MPSTYPTVKGWIESIPNAENRKIIYDFVTFMDSTDTSMNYRRGNLIVVIFFARHLQDKNISEVNSKGEIIKFLDTRRKEVALDPDKKWIRTWNDYFQRVKYFLRWYYNGAPRSVAADSTIPLSDWQTPEFLRIKAKKTNRISPYSESEIWELNDLLRIIKYEPLKRN